MSTHIPHLHPHLHHHLHQHPHPHPHRLLLLLLLLLPLLLPHTHPQHHSRSQTPPDHCAGRDAECFVVAAAVGVGVARAAAAHVSDSAPTPEPAPAHVSGPMYDEGRMHLPGDQSLGQVVRHDEINHKAWSVIKQNKNRRGCEPCPKFPNKIKDR